MSGFQVKVMTPVDQGSSPCGETSSFFFAHRTSTRESALLCRSRVVRVIMAEKLFVFLLLFKCLVSFLQNGIFSSLTKNKKKREKKKKRSWFCRDTYVMSFMSSGVIYGTPSGLTTIEIEIKKRRIGERDSLWGLIVKNDDICFTHVLPRLNATDIKFLYEVNPETRALVKRSSRASDLKKRFKINEMSSISTLEFAWEHFPWGKEVRYGRGFMEEQYFCMKVARTNKLELLKWAREEKKCEWEQDTIYAAAYQGNLEMVKYCVANECPINEEACVYAAKNGHLECLKYLHEEAKAPWDWRSAAWAAANGHLHILEYLVERKYDKYDAYACEFAAENGNLDCLKYLHETAKAPWNYWAVQVAHENKHPDCLQYLLDNDCPLPDGWRYEHGELHTI